MQLHRLHRIRRPRAPTRWPPLLAFGVLSHRLVEHTRARQACHHREQPDFSYQQSHKDESCVLIAPAS